MEHFCYVKSLSIIVEFTQHRDYCAKKRLVLVSKIIKHASLITDLSLTGKFSGRGFNLEFFHNAFESDFHHLINCTTFKSQDFATYYYMLPPNVTSLTLLGDTYDIANFQLTYETVEKLTTDHIQNVKRFPNLKILYLQKRSHF